MNIKPFNIHEMMEKVASIQREKAKEQGLKLRTQAINISKQSQEGAVIHKSG